ncbi:MAG: MBL fold metallo-hydrolase [Thermodesulfobacteriota bacterium]
MKITDRVYAVRHPFRLLLGEGIHVERFVYSYLIVGESICLIDTGVAATAPLILELVQSLGRTPEEISLILLTHGHPDHMGGCGLIKSRSGARVAVHPAEKRWVVDLQEQYRERPIPNLFELAGEGVPVEMELADGQRIAPEDGKAIRVIGTPGHSPGSVAFFDEADGVLFSGDAVPDEGSIPIYTDPSALVASIGKLAGIAGVRVLLSSWHDPVIGEGIGDIMEKGRRTIERTGAVVREIHDREPHLSGAALSRKVLEQLGIRLPRVLFMVEAAIHSHLPRRAESGPSG